jgi:small-conductance mechanosensitive channel
LGQSIARLFLSTLIPVFGLYLLRLILASLPMIKNAGPIADLGVTPLILIKSALDTVVFFLIIRFALGASQQIKTARPHWDEIGNLAVLVGAALVAVLAYNGYEALAASLMPAQLEVYNWVFLVIVLIPVALVVIIVTRRMDFFTELMFGKLSAAVATPQSSYAAPPVWGAAPPQGPPPSFDPVEQQTNERVAAVQQKVALARQTAERLRARGMVNGDFNEAVTKMEGYLDGAVKSRDKRDWTSAKGFADWAEYEASRIVAAGN